MTNGKPDDWKLLTWGKLPFTKTQTCNGATGSKPKYHSYLSARRVGGRGSADGTEIVSVGMPHGKRGIVLRMSTSVENFDLNELQRNFLFPLQIISPRPVSTSDIYPVPIAEKHMY